MGGPLLETVGIPGGHLALRDARTGTTREVTLRPFGLATTPVTWAAYSDVLGHDVPAGVTPDAPVHGVSWFDAVAWCNAASRRRGLRPAYVVDGATVAWDVGADGLRLPTEAEWEWACRAGTDGPRYGPLAEIAWSASYPSQRLQTPTTSITRTIASPTTRKHQSWKERSRRIRRLRYIAAVPLVSHKLTPL